MKINAELIIRLRQDRSWSQDELAIAAGLNLRTIQRIEREATASLQSRKAIASALDVAVQDLIPGSNAMKSCPECASENIFKLKDEMPSDYGYSPFMLPKLGTALDPAKLLPVICVDCGYIRHFASVKAREKLQKSKYWQPV